MRAVFCTSYGAPEVLQLKDVAKPTPKRNQLLIKVHAAAVTASDIPMRQGTPFIVRFFTGLRNPNFIPGDIITGEVEAVGEAVTRFKPGDAVFGSSVTDAGAYAEYVCLAEDGVVAHKPSNMRLEEAAGLTDGATTALVFLRDKAQVAPGQHVLINGASGAIGCFAVQLAKLWGAEVTGVCSTKNVDLVRSLGADHVIDYTQHDFTGAEGVYDVIFDAVGKRTFSDCKQALKSTGVYLNTTPSLGIVLHMLRTSRSRGKRAVFATAGLEQNQDHLQYLCELVEAGKLRTVIDRQYPLEEVVAAHRYVEQGHKVGTVVLTIGQDNIII